MTIRFENKQGKAFVYHTMGKHCKNAPIGQELKEVLLHEVHLTSKEDVEDLIEILKATWPGFVDSGMFSKEQYLDLLRRTD